LTNCAAKSNAGLWNADLIAGCKLSNDSKYFGNFLG
jgi:hypothetical protein